MPALDLCVFDLDGTLVDTLRDIGESLNDCLEILGLRTHPIDDYRYMVGEGMPNLCRKAIDPNYPWLLERLTDLARARYRTRPLRHSRPYPRIDESIRAAAAHAGRLAVLSNKPHDMTLRVVQHFWPDPRFDCIRGYTGEVQRKPDPAALLQICHTLGAQPQRTCLIGDTPVDILTARNAGTHAIAVTWGFRTRADLQQAGCTSLIDEPAQLEAALDELSRALAPR